VKTTADRPTVVPYITAREGERPVPESQLVVWPGRGLVYRHEVEGDRDRQGVLWARTSQSRENGQVVGRPRWRDVHPARQRECMERLRCQGCAGPASRTDAGYLFLASPVSSNTVPGWPEGHLTAQPPLCLEHAKVSVEQCGYLVRSGAVALRAQVPRLYGVLGTRYACGLDGKPRAIDADDPAGSEVYPYRHRHLRPWLLASQLVRQLCEVTEVDLAEELTGTGGAS